MKHVHFFWDPHGRLFFVWPLALLAAAVSLRCPARWPGWLLLAAGVNTCAVVTVLMPWTPLENADFPFMPEEGDVRTGPFNLEEDARRVIAGYLQAVAAGDAGALQSYVWRYAEASAERPPLQKDEIQGQLEIVGSSGFRAGGLLVEVFRVELLPDGPLFFVLARGPGDGTLRLAAVSREPVNIHARDAGPVDAAWREDAEKAVRGYFDALERRDFGSAVSWVHPAWHDFTAMPERELRSLRLLSVRFCGVAKVGRVVLFECAVEAWARYQGVFSRQPYPRLSGRNTYFVMLAPLDPPTPAEWRIVCIGSGP